MWGCGFALVLNRSRDRLAAAQLSCSDRRQVVHTHVPLSPSSIIWYQLISGDAVRLRRSGVAL